MANNKFSEILGRKLLKISKQISFEVLDKLCTYLECPVGDILEHKKHQTFREGESSTTCMIFLYRKLL